MIFVTLARVVPGKGTQFVEALRSGAMDQSRLPEGVKAHSAYITYGQYDLVLILEARDLSAENRALKQLITTGIVTTETLVGQTVSEFIS